MEYTDSPEGQFAMEKAAHEATEDERREAEETGARAAPRPEGEREIEGVAMRAALRIEHLECQGGNTTDDNAGVIASAIREVLTAQLAAVCAERDTLQRQLERFQTGELLGRHGMQQADEISELRRARVADSEIIGRWQCQAEKAEADLAGLRSRGQQFEDEHRHLREMVAFVTHLVDPHDLKSVETLTLAELEDGLREQCVVRLDAAENELEALRSRGQALVQQWREEAAAEQRVSFCADQLAAVLTGAPKENEDAASRGDGVPEGARRDLPRPATE